MEIREIQEKENWQTGDQFLQSWEWGDFQKKMGRKIWRLAVQEKNKTLVQALIIKNSLPLGFGYLYCPRGPFFQDVSGQVTLDFFFKQIKVLADQEKAIFFRFEPLKEISLSLKIKKTSDVQPSQTAFLDLQKKEADLLSAMHSKTRYNIRLAQRKGVEIEESQSLDCFWRLLQETAKREEFQIHDFEYYRELLNLSQSKLYLARYLDKILAAHLVIFFNQRAFYVHGGSSREFSQVMAPHLLHWEAIRIANNNKCEYYDFWGIDSQKWPGLTKFKMNFGCRQVTYPGTFDLPFSSFWYNLYRVGKIFKK
ncbi:peptidoglycan bridge formation glycyltransferase FemA/FemB family protein [Patescibacteria group bacterium]|nr:peptidoglycan bridge formation glycyltransferase FemA/FemB family protein [Patescibacteria group bacterium]